MIFDGTVLVCCQFCLTKLLMLHQFLDAVASLEPYHETQSVMLFPIQS